MLVYECGGGEGGGEAASEELHLTGKFLVDSLLALSRPNFAELARRDAITRCTLRRDGLPRAPHPPSHRARSRTRWHRCRDRVRRQVHRRRARMLVKTLNPAPRLLKTDVRVPCTAGPGPSLPRSREGRRPCHRQHRARLLGSDDHAVAQGRPRGDDAGRGGRRRSRRQRGHQD